MIYIIVLNWNGASDTLACLGSLKNLLPVSQPHSIVVCDNGSTDDSLRRITAYIQESEVSNLTLVRSESNLGFAGGMNLGMRHALADPDTEFLWLLNNDTVVEPAALRHLVEKMQNTPDIGMCGSTLLYFEQPDVIQAVGGRFNSWLAVSRHVLGHEPYSPTLCDTVDERTLDYVVGASLFVRRSVVDRIGLLAEDYFLYCEEIDWATRMKRLIPYYRIGYEPQSRVWHKEGAATGANELAGKTYSYFSDFFFITSRLRFSRRFYPWCYPVVRLSMLLVALNRVRRRQYRSALLAVCALFVGVPEFMDPRLIKSP